MSSYIIVLLVVASMATGGFCARPAQDYLLFSEADSQELRWVIKRIESRAWGQDVESVASNLKAAQSLALRASLDGVESIQGADTLGISDYDPLRMFWLSGILSDLSEFAYDNPRVVECNSLQARTFVAAVNAEFGGLKKFQRSLERAGAAKKSLLFRYLEHYGRRHCAECLESLASRLDGSEFPRDLELKFALIGMGEGLKINPEQVGKDEATDLRLLARAERLDWARGRFNAKQMLAAVQQIIQSSSADGTQIQSWPKQLMASGRLLADFIVELCRDQKLWRQLDMYNLAKIMAPEAVRKLELPVRYRKLNEYHRICMPFNDLVSRESARSNVVRNMLFQGIRSALGLTKN